MTNDTAGVRTFVIADIRGYSRYTEECGDEAAAALTKRFSQIVNDDADSYDGELVEMRGDEALVVFTSARQAIRAAVDLQAQFQEAAVEFQIPLRVGIGIDSGTTTSGYSWATKNWRNGCPWRMAARRRKSYHRSSCSMLARRA